MGILSRLFRKDKATEELAPLFNAVRGSVIWYSNGKEKKQADLYRVARQLYGDEQFCKDFSKYRDLEQLKIDLIQGFEKTKQPLPMTHKVFAESREISERMVSKLRGILGIPEFEDGGMTFNYVLALLLLIVKRIADIQDSNFFLLTLPVPPEGS